MLDNPRSVFLVVVKTKHVPGALGDVASGMGRAGFNILSVGDCSDPGNPDSTVSFFVQPLSAETEKQLKEVLLASPYVVDSHVKKGESKLLVDDSAFPVMFFPAGRGNFLPQSGVKAMFQDMVRMFGTGGESILFRAGRSGGSKAAEDLAKVFGANELAKEPEAFSALYGALGGGR